MPIPNQLADIFGNGLVVDIALAFIVLEFLTLATRAYLGGRPKHILAVSIALAPGICLMLALRCALTGGAPLWVAFWLTLSLPFHIWDVLSRKL